MDSALSLQIQCPVCLSDFTDPVSLPCDHSFCRHCITGHMQVSVGQSLCPVCRRPFIRRKMKANRGLRNMVDAAREHLAEHQALIDMAAAITTGTETETRPQEQGSSELVCPEHDEKLKLFCETDQELVCLICRDGDEHQGHTFKPVKDAANIRKEEMRGALHFLSHQGRELDDLIQLQTAEITKTKLKSIRLSAQISAEFEEMHQFLRKREEEVKTELEKEERNALETMQENLSVMKGKLKDERILLSGLDITQPNSFLQWWVESGFPVVEGMKQDSGDDGAKETPPRTKYRSKVKGLSVTPDSLTLGPYETHLPFFVWKKMFGSIKSVPHRHTIKDIGDPYLNVSPGGLAVQRTDNQGLFSYYKNYRPLATTHATYVTGRHYWEVEVGGKLDWAVGVTGDRTHHKLTEVMLCLRHDEEYSVVSKGNGTPVDLKVKPRKIGVYLDCEGWQVYFYNADSMTLIHTMRCLPSSFSLSLSPGVFLDGRNNDPLTVCCY